MADVPTIRTLAKLAGVSSATVSLALRNHPRIRPHVRERIQQIAKEAGYRPNPIVSHLIAQVRASRRASYQSTLGVVFTTKDPGHLESRPLRNGSRPVKCALVSPATASTNSSSCNRASLLSA